MKNKNRYILPTALGLLLLASSAPGLTHAQDAEISTFAECEIAGGEISVLQLRVFPPRTQTRCMIEGEVFIKDQEGSSDSDEQTEEVRTRENTDNSNIEVREEVRIRLEERSQEVEERRELARERAAAGHGSLSVESRTRIENFASGLFTRMTAGAERLREIAERIESRINKLQDEGFDLSAETEMLAEAKLSTDRAEVEVSEAQLALDVMLASETPREMLVEVKTELAEAKTALREAKRSLLEVVQSIKQRLSEGSAEASLESEAEVNLQ